MKRKKKSHYHTGSYTSSKTGKVYEYRSGWEEKYMRWLDQNPDVLTWSYEELLIQYISNLKTRRVRKYIPDFCVEYKSGRKVIVEIKPADKVDAITNKKKFRFAENWCQTNKHDFEIVTEHELKGLGIL